MEFVKEIKEMTRTSFKVSAIPIKHFNEFKNYCEDFGDVYWVGIVQLMKQKKKLENTTQLISHLQAQIDSLQHQLNKMEVKNE